MPPASPSSRTLRSSPATWIISLAASLSSLVFITTVVFRMMRSVSQCAPDPTLDETVPLDPEITAINSFVSQALSLQVNIEEQYYCMDCAVLQSVISPDLSFSD